MKKLMYLAITFLTFIFSFIAPMKNNLNININNNKIVEKTEPKRAFENAPEKETSLPGFNKEFKVYFNISTLEEFKSFYRTLDLENETTESPILLYYGSKNIEEENLNAIFLISAINYSDKLQLTLSIQYEQGLSTFNYYYYYDTEEINFILFEGQSEQPLTESLLNDQFNLLNNSINTTSFYSNTTFNVEDMSINVSNYLENQSYIYGYDVVTTSAVPGLIGTISSIATGLLSLLISLFSTVVAIFWNVSNNTPTFLGVVLLFVVAVPITYWVINFVIGLIKKIRLTRGK